MCTNSWASLELSRPHHSARTPRAVQVPGVHDPLDPEYTILKQRLARRIRCR